MESWEQLYVLNLSKQTRTLRQNIFKNPTVTNKKNTFGRGVRGERATTTSTTKPAVPKAQQGLPPLRHFSGISEMPVSIPSLWYLTVWEKRKVKYRHISSP